MPQHRCDRLSLGVPFQIVLRRIPRDSMVDTRTIRSTFADAGLTHPTTPGMTDLAATHRLATGNADFLASLPGLGNDPLLEAEISRRGAG